MNLFSFALTDNDLLGLVDSGVRIDNIALGKGFNGKTGDILSFDLKDTYSGSSFLDLDLSLQHLIGSDHLKIGNQFTASNVDLNTSTFAQDGLFHVVPDFEETNSNGIEEGITVLSINGDRT